MARRDWPGGIGQEGLARRDWPGGIGQEGLAWRDWLGGIAWEGLPGRDCLGGALWSKFCDGQAPPVDPRPASIAPGAARMCTPRCESALSPYMGAPRRQLFQRLEQRTRRHWDGGGVQDLQLPGGGRRGGAHRVSRFGTGSGNHSNSSGGEHDTLLQRSRRHRGRLSPQCLGVVDKPLDAAWKGPQPWICILPATQRDDRSDVLVAGKFIAEEDEPPGKPRTPVDLRLRQHRQYSSKDGLWRFQSRRVETAGIAPGASLRALRLIVLSDRFARNERYLPGLLWRRVVVHRAWSLLCIR